MQTAPQLRLLSAAILSSFLLAGCGSVNNVLAEKTKQVEYIRVFDIQTNAERNIIAESASNGLGRNVSDVQESRSIPSTTNLAEKAVRKINFTNPFEGTKLAAFVGNNNTKIAVCGNDSVWSATATRTIQGQSQLKLTACLYPYQKGYSLDMYAHFVKKEGGVMELTRQAASAMVGTPEEWTEKTFLDVVRQIKKDTNADITLVEADPKIQGTPWLDPIVSH